MYEKSMFIGPGNKRIVQNFLLKKNLKVKEIILFYNLWVFKYYLNQYGIIN